MISSKFCFVLSAIAKAAASDLAIFDSLVADEAVAG
jgi:hypothetical protein